MTRLVVRRRRRPPPPPRRRKRAAVLPIQTRINKLVRLREAHRYQRGGAIFFTLISGLILLTRIAVVAIRAARAAAAVARVARTVSTIVKATKAVARVGKIIKTARVVKNAKSAKSALGQMKKAKKMFDREDMLELITPDEPPPSQEQKTTIPKGVPKQSKVKGDDASERVVSKKPMDLATLKTEVGKLKQTDYKAILPKKKSPSWSVRGRRDAARRWNPATESRGTYVYRKLTKKKKDAEKKRMNALKTWHDF